MNGPFHHQAFGLVWESAVPLPYFDEAPACAPDVVVELCEGEPPGLDEIDSWGRVRIGPAGFHYCGGDWTIEAGRSRIRLFPKGSPDKPLPVQLFSTVVAGVMALRGNIPIHGSTVAFGDTAVLVTGRGDAGKSSFSALLMQEGGRLVSDDLSVLVARENGFAVVPGRPFIRLYPEVAANIPAAVRSTEEDGKIRLDLRASDRAGETALKRIVCLDMDQSTPPASMRRRMLIDMLFRSRGLRGLPGREERGALLDRVADTIVFVRLRSLADRDLAGARARAAELAREMMAVSAPPS